MNERGPHLHHANDRAIPCDNPACESGDADYYEYISISWAGTSPSGKTNIYSVTNNRSGVELGTIKWHGAWRQYVVSLHAETIYSRGCLDDISAFLATLATRPRGSGR